MLIQHLLAQLVGTAGGGAYAAASKGLKRVLLKGQQFSLSILDSNMFSDGGGGPI
jgi:hypothetical protein